MEVLSCPILSCLILFCSVLRPAARTKKKHDGEDRSVDERLLFLQGPEPFIQWHTFVVIDVAARRLFVVEFLRLAFWVAFRLAFWLRSLGRLLGFCLFAHPSGVRVCKAFSLWTGAALRALVFNPTTGIRILRPGHRVSSARDSSSAKGCRWPAAE
jgi:hypothetical protein